MDLEVGNLLKIHLPYKNKNMILNNSWQKLAQGEKNLHIELEFTHRGWQPYTSISRNKIREK